MNLWEKNNFENINLRLQQIVPGERGRRLKRAGVSLSIMYSCCERMGSVAQDRWYFPNELFSQMNKPCPPQFLKNLFLHYAKKIVQENCLSVRSTPVRTLMLPTLVYSDPLPLQPPDVGPQDRCYGGRGHG